MKIENRNLLLMGLPALLFLAAGILLFQFGDSLFAAAQSSMPEAPGGDVGDVEGYAFLLGFLGSGFGQLAALAIQILAFLLAVYGGLLTFWAVLVRAIYRVTPGRILAYRILVGFDLLFLLLPVPSLLLSFLRSLFALSPHFLPLAIAALLSLISALVIRNTYTSRIAPALPEAAAGQREGIG